MVGLSVFIFCIILAQGQQEEVTQTVAPSNSALIIQSIRGGDYHAGNKIVVQSHNYDARGGLFLQSQYNGEIKNSFPASPIEESFTSESETAVENVHDKVTTVPTMSTMNSEIVFGPDHSGSPATMETTTKYVELSSEPPGSEIPNMEKAETTLAPTSTATVPSKESTPEMNLLKRASDLATPLESILFGSGANLLSSDTVHDEQQRHHLRNSNPYYPAHRSIVQQHFYDGRSGILMQNQYNGKIEGETSSESARNFRNFPIPSNFLFNLVNGGRSPFLSNLFREPVNNREAKSAADGHSKSEQSEVEVGTSDDSKTGDKRSSSFGAGLNRFLTEQVQKMAAEASKGRSDGAPTDGRRWSGFVVNGAETNDQSMEHVFRESVKRMNTAEEIVNKLMNFLTNDNNKAERTLHLLNDEPIDKNEVENSGEGETTNLSTMETTTNLPNVENSSNLIIDTMPANIRINAFNVANGGEAYQIIFENPDIDINILQPTDQPIEKTTFTTPTDETTDGGLWPFKHPENIFARFG